MKQFVVVVWDVADVSYMSFVELSRELIVQYREDESVLYDRALDARLTFPGYAVELMQEYIENFSTLSHADVVEVDTDMHRILLTLTSKIDVAS